MNNIKQILVMPVRFILTAYCFVQFAIQVLWLGKWRMPRLLRSEGNPSSQRRKALYSAHRHVTFYLKTLSFFGLVEFKTIGQPSSIPGIVIANHPSLLDFIVFLRDYPHAICMYKPQSLNNPVLSSFVKVAGYIAGMRGAKGENKRIVADCGERLKQGHHVVIFPEGSRSPGAKTLRKFRSTAFHAAIKNDAPIQPVAIYCEPLFLGKGQRWAAFSKHKNTITLKYLPPIQLADLNRENQSASGLANTTKTAILNALEQM
jgi:1-acyl-sn-glycerol-3-phosphate acyltransferase